MSLTERAAWILERNASESQTLAGLAAACGVSRSHLAHAFGTATGTPVMQYLRGRRLSEAARSLAAGAPDILTVALDTGYGSHEAFTRAFRDQFGRTPESVRQQGSLEGLPLVASVELHGAADRQVESPRFVTSTATRAVGLTESVSFATTMRIPGQWQRFMSQHFDAIPHRIEGMPIGLTLPADDDGGFAYACAVEVRSFDDAPAGLDRFDLPARSYAVFEHHAHVSTIFDTYAAIWNVWLPAAGRSAADAPAIEHHHDAFDPSTGEGGLSIWIPLTPATAPPRTP
ncbi:MAG TPA: AraC family transcriptional regulator [Luteitalea sp.]|nr:AraC family transcriptional regulator [Luteitalea sp.]